MAMPPSYSGMKKLSSLMEMLSLTKCFQQTDRTDQVHSNDKGGREMEVGYWNDVVQQSSSWSSAPTAKSDKGIVKVSIMHSSSEV